MGQGLGGMLIDAAEQHSERCLAAAGLGLHPSVGCRLGGKEEKQQNETMAGSCRGATLGGTGHISKPSNVGYYHGS